MASEFLSSNGIPRGRPSFTIELCGFEMKPDGLTISPWGFLIQLKRDPNHANWYTPLFLLNPADGEAVRQETLNYLKERFPEELAQWELTE